MLLGIGACAVDLAPIYRDGDWMFYDDGTPQWCSWGGTYRGTWFNTQDFVSTSSGCTLEKSCLWFYHHSCFQWDISDVYIEIWNGGSCGPITEVNCKLITAQHYCPTYIEYAPTIEVEQNFWYIINTELSTGGWPSILTDGVMPNPSSVEHSYSSDDFIVWEPWNINGVCNYILEVSPLSFLSLNTTTWANIKTIF